MSPARSVLQSMGLMQARRSSLIMWLWPSGRCRSVNAVIIWVRSKPLVSTTAPDSDRGIAFSDRGACSDLHHTWLNEVGTGISGHRTPA